MVGVLGGRCYASRSVSGNPHEGPASGYQDALLRAVASVDPQQPVLLNASMQALVEDSLAARSFLMLVLVATGWFALAMSAAGIYA